ncbi:MAG TPA: Co2+/Mg2+ efflux protein ApaG [Saprospiraceae bacterium]|nr:Co2+/Mg2+ efflux protein ApaG [Saprospiraceae bacterium]
METLTTNGVKITVTTSYQSKFSKPLENRFVFAYTVNIQNNNDFTVQLLRRHWYILDSNGILREVEGDGVIGKQPVLSPGESHQYVSWSQLLTDVGKMYGTYLMVRQMDGEAFRVRIPEFKLVAPFKLN